MKIISALLVIAMLFSLAACADETVPEVIPQETAPPVESTPDPTPKPTPEPTPKPTPEPTPEPVEEVTITLPASWFGDDAFIDLSYLSDDMGLGGLVDNPDGSKSLTMTRDEHNKLMKELEGIVVSALDELKSDDSFIVLKSYEYSDDFRTIDLFFDKLTFNAPLFELGLLAIIYTAGVYLVFLEDDVYYEVNIYDDATKELVNTIIIPDDLNL